MLNKHEINPITIAFIAGVGGAAVTALGATLRGNPAYNEAIDASRRLPHDSCSLG
jgi:hypothetical protein